MHEKQVEKLIENLDVIKKYCFQARVRTPKTFVDWLDRTCIPYLKGKIAELSGEYKKQVTILLNGAVSLREGISQGEAGLDDAAAFGRDVRLATIAIEMQKNKDDEAKSPEEKKKDQAWGRDGLVTMTTESEPVIRKYSIWKDDLPVNLFSRPFVIKRLPIIPLSDPPLNFEKLKKTKISTDHISYYPILLNQPLIGLNFNWIMTEFRGKSDKAIKYVLDAAKDRFNKAYHPTGLPVHHGKVVWVWIPSDKDVAKIQAASPVGRVNVKKWGFPFKV